MIKALFWLNALLLITGCTAGRQLPATLHVHDPNPHQFWSADWSPDGKYIAVAGVDSMIRIFHARDLKLYKSFPINDWTHIVEWHPNQFILAAATLHQGTLLIHPEPGTMSPLPDIAIQGSASSAYGSRGMAWNGQGTLLASAGLDGIIRLYDENGDWIKSISLYPPQTDYIGYLALDWHPIENNFVAANFEIMLLDTAGDLQARMEHQNKAAILLCAEWHPSGTFFVLGDYGLNWEGENVPSLLHFWSSDGQYIKAVHGSKGEIRNIAWSPDGQMLATASDVLRIWDKEGHLLHESPPDGTNTLWGIDWSPDGKRIVTASNHKSVAIWSHQGRKIRSVEVD